MDVNDIFKDRQSVLLDGAVGTEIERRGYKAHSKLWTAPVIRDNPQLLLEIHQAYISSGAQIITAHTFRTDAYTLRDHSLDLFDSSNLTKSAVHIARQAAKGATQPIWVAGSIATLEDCYQPSKVPDDKTLWHYHQLHVAELINAGVNLIIAETINTQREALILAAILAQSGCPFMISFIPGNVPGHILSGEKLETIFNALIHHKPVAVMLNCAPALEIDQHLPFLSQWPGPLGVYANGPGKPCLEHGWCREEQVDDRWVRRVRAWNERGVKLLGGCCGTTPEDIRALKLALDGVYF